MKKKFKNSQPQTKFTGSCIKKEYNFQKTLETISLEH